MSRIGRMPIPVPRGTKVEVAGRRRSWPRGRRAGRAGPLRRLSRSRSRTTADQVTRPGDERPRALAATACCGRCSPTPCRASSAGFTKQLDIVGVGYRAEVKGQQVQFALGYSHPVIFDIPEGIKIAIDAKANRVTVTGADRQQVGQVAAEIRNLRRPDPYKGKGIKYTREVLRRKVGKAGGK